MKDKTPRESRLFALLVKNYLLFTLTLLVMAVMTLGVVLAYDGRKVKALTGFRHT